MEKRTPQPSGTRRKSWALLSLVALALFAHIATPQVRLTRDPNTFFFFLDHLDNGSPFRLEDDTSWDTNIERGIYWGLRLFEKDEELQGKSANAKAFILISDGQAWSGEVAKSLSLAQGKGIPVHVVGVGTIVGQAQRQALQPLPLGHDYLGRVLIRAGHLEPSIPPAYRRLTTGRRFLRCAAPGRIYPERGTGRTRSAGSPAAAAAPPP